MKKIALPFLALLLLVGVGSFFLIPRHHYSSMVEWSRAFGGAPIYLRTADRQWVMRPADAIVLWQGNTKKLDRDGRAVVNESAERYLRAIGG